MNMKIPAAIVSETRVNELDNTEVFIGNPRYGDCVNLSTGEASVVRMIGGLRYDSAASSLVAGVGEYIGFRIYVLLRLYRTAEGRFFGLKMFSVDGDARIDLQAFDEHEALAIARSLVAGENVVEFLREWYCAGLLPIDDEYVRDWAESALPAGECEQVLAAMAGRFAPRADTEDPATKD